MAKCWSGYRQNATVVNGVYIEGKMDIAHLLPILRRISSEHRALKLLLRESDQNWKTDVLRLQRAPKLSKDVDEQFREVVTSLQSGESDDLVIAKLINALDKTNLE